MNSRRVLQAGVLLWAAVGASVAIPAVTTASNDARLLVGTASVLGPVAAIAASASLARRFDRLAGVLLLASVVTPTYFAWALNVPAFVVGLVLVAAPGIVLPDNHRGKIASSSS